MPLQELRVAIRSLAKAPAFSIAAIACLALGIGGNTAVFSAARAILLRPFPYRDPAHLVAVAEARVNTTTGWEVVSYPNFRDWQAGARTFEGMGIYSTNAFNVTSSDQAAHVSGATVSWTLFRVLGVTPALGRDFVEQEDIVGAPKVVIVSHRFWLEHLQGSRAVVGSSLSLNGTPHTVIGVMPEGFNFPSVADIWTPVQQEASAGRGNHSWEVVGRLRPGLEPAIAQADLARIAADLAERYPMTNEGWSVRVVPLREYAAGSLKNMIYLLGAAVALLLLVAGANVANLFLARGSDRAREIAVRVALGASPGRVLRQLVLEGLLVGVTGAVLGLAVAEVFLVTIRSGVIVMPFWMQFRLDWQVLAYAMMLAVLTGVVLGLIPSLQKSRALAESLRDATRRTTGNRQRRTLRRTLVIGEIAMSMVLLVSATLLIRSLTELQRVEIGLDPRNILTMRMGMLGAPFDSAFKRAAFLDRLVARMNQIPGIAAAAIVTSAPMSGSYSSNYYVVENSPVTTGREPLVEHRYASANYLETMRIPLLAGRMFDARESADTGAAGAVAVVNESFARKYWTKPTESIGKRFRLGYAADSARDWITIIGIAGDVRQRSLTERVREQAYLPLRQSAQPYVSLVLRTTDHPRQLVAPVLSALKELSPMLSAYRIFPMEELIARTYWQSSLLTKMLTIFGILGLMLAAIGVYGVISYTVSQRIPELGVRLALGAQPRDVFRLIVGDGLAMATIGLGLGLVGTVAVSKVLRSSLVGVSPLDPVSLGLVTGTLLLATLLASYIPARRAVVINPADTLRQD